MSKLALRNANSLHAFAPPYNTGNTCLFVAGDSDTVLCTCFRCSSLQLALSSECLLTGLHPAAQASYDLTSQLLSFAACSCLLLCKTMSNWCNHLASGACDAASMRVVSQDQGAASQPEESWLGSVRDRRHASAEGLVADALARRCPRSRCLR